MNLLRSTLAAHLALATDKHSYVIKKGNAYTCIKSENLKLLDIAQFMANSCSYEMFLKSFQIPQAKGYFPYEYLTNFAKLSETTLPPIEAYYSQLKGHSTLESQERRDYVACLETGLSQDEALKQLKLTAVPPSKEQVYETQRQLWDEKKMTTLLQYLEHYNNLDVLPFVQGISMLLSFYKKKNIDLFKSCISVPGAARLLLYKSMPEDTSLALIAKQDADLYDTIRQNVVGEYICIDTYICMEGCKDVLFFFSHRWSIDNLQKTRCIWTESNKKRYWRITPG